MKELFGHPDTDSDPYRVVKGYFDRMYHDGDFIKSLELLVKKWGFSTDGAYCNFPDLSSFSDEDNFDGVEFAYGYPPREEDTIVVSEDICSKYIKLACERYLNIHPDDAVKVKAILDRLSF